jgi:hypothetical protein
MVCDLSGPFAEPPQSQNPLRFLLEKPSVLRKQPVGLCKVWGRTILLTIQQQAFAQFLKDIARRLNHDAADRNAA